MDNKRRIQELKRKNQVVNICKTWKSYGIDISVENFLGVQETLLLQDKILEKLDQLDNNNTSIIYQGTEKEMISDFTKTLIRYIINDEEYVFFAKEATMIGGLVLKGKTIIEKNQFIIKESEFFNKGCSIFFCSLNADKGVCLWKNEYNSYFYIW